MANGQGGIRTREGLVAPTRSPGVRLKPLGHLSRVVLLDEKLERSRLSVYGALLEPGTYG